ncbi:chalcone isomerase family protein [Paraglaciecola aquimarina]|uniref:Chalcone isomerase family protein n=1 Tax=Paraglaciecola algarum TaxID=3050085 RepID=A0ABS9DCR0_9ALTE|nr:chalcone isomerase family protein [Paraglaciecola sp. G1-23]MCF2949793.1 chalcone isomerase family protein [Paraglaciecola sp. G1-23]
MFYKLIVSIFVLFFIQPISAEQASEDKSAIGTTQQASELLKLKDVGEATFSVLFWDIYTSKLKTSTGKYPLENAEDNLLFQIHYLRDIKSEDLILRTIEQWQHLGVPEDKYQAYLPRLNTLWPDIKKGDSLALLINNHTSVFYFNDSYLGEITQAEFGQQFLDIWLSEKTSQPKLRLELLKGKSNE